MSLRFEVQLYQLDAQVVYREKHSCISTDCNTNRKLIRLQQALGSLSTKALAVAGCLLPHCDTCFHARSYVWLKASPTSLGHYAVFWDVITTAPAATQTKWQFIPGHMQLSPHLCRVFRKQSNSADQPSICWLQGKSCLWTSKLSSMMERSMDIAAILHWT